MLVQGGLVKDEQAGLNKVEAVLSSGKAAEKFAQMVSALGGPNDLIEKPTKYLATAPIIQPIYPKQSGYIVQMDTRKIGMSVVTLGGGRRAATDQIDYSVGLSDFCHIGDQVELDQPIVFVHAKTKSQADEISKHLLEIIKISKKQETRPELILDKIKKNI
jgi:thymidine phosphorylase